MNFFNPNHVIPDIKEQFLRFSQGKTRFRFIGEPITGFEYFILTDENKGSKLSRPEEAPFTQEELDMLRPHPNSNGRPRYFMACIVYLPEEDHFKILSITQKGLMESIKDCVSNPAYGDVSKYDFVVTKKGEGMETEYTIIPNPPTELPAEVVKRSKNLKCNLQAIFDSEYPAASFPFETEGVEPETINEEQQTKLRVAAGKQGWNSVQVKQELAKFGFTSTDQVTTDKYDEILSQFETLKETNND